MQNQFMFVDDDDTFHLLTAHVCRKITALPEPLRAMDGLEGLDLLRDLLGSADRLPSVIFVDVNMPRMDGFGFLDGLATLRAEHPELLRIRVVTMLTSSDQGQDRDRAQDRGADDYLVKPAGLADLRTVLERFVA